MAKAPVLKTGGRKPLQVRILCPPLPTETTVTLPAAPRQITLNPLESVLAEVRTEPWEN